MDHKLFIVSRDHPEILESLRRAVAGERGVEVILDRRLSDDVPASPRAERRVGPGIDTELKERGFAVVRVAAPARSFWGTDSPRGTRFRF